MGVRACVREGELHAASEGVGQGGRGCACLSVLSVETKARTEEVGCPAGEYMGAQWGATACSKWCLQVAGGGQYMYCSPPFKPGFSQNGGHLQLHAICV